MIKKENACVDCGLPCMGKNCPYRNITVLSCDICDNIVDELYEYKTQQLCNDCVTKEISKEIERDGDVENAEEKIEQELLFLGKIII